MARESLATLKLSAAAALGLHPANTWMVETSASTMASELLSELEVSAAVSVGTFMDWDLEEGQPIQMLGLVKDRIGT